MKISIVTPVLNDLRVGRALDSILSQQHEHDLELIVIDAGSTDRTLDVLKAYKDKITVLVSEPDAGIYDGMNKGILKATGDIVGILNADDQYSDPFVLRDVLQVFSEATVDACYGNMVYTDAAGQVVRYWKVGTPRRGNWYLGWAPPHPTFFVRKSVYDRYGAFNLHFPIAADYELMLRLIFKYRINVKCLDRVLVNMAPGGNATRSIAQIARGNREVIRAWQWNHLRGGFLIPLVRLARRPFQLLRRPP